VLRLFCVSLLFDPAVVDPFAQFRRR
jgi:hypothetical protein